MSNQEQPIVWKLSDARAGWSAAEELMRDVNLEVRKEERIAFLGYGRSGRKIALRVMCGLRPLRGGSMKILDHFAGQESFRKDWDDLLPRSVKAKLGVSLEVDGLLSNVTVQEGMELLFRFRFGDRNQKLRDGARKAVESLGKKFGIPDIMEKRPVELTSSETKLAALARSYLARPSLILIEEPSRGVGELSHLKLWNLLDELFRDKRRTVILSTEDLRLAWRYCNRWVVFDKSHIVFDGAKEDFVKTRHPMLKLVDPMVSRTFGIKEAS